MVLRLIVVVVLMTCTSVSRAAEEPRTSLHCDCQSEEGTIMVKYFTLMWGDDEPLVRTPSAVMDRANYYCLSKCIKLFLDSTETCSLLNMQDPIEASCKSNVHDYRLVLLIPSSDRQNVDTLAFSQDGCMLLNGMHKQPQIRLLKHLTTVLPYMISCSLREHLWNRYNVAVPRCVE